nr:MAG TPA: hypothetical protein [Caudoviricetes sp.]
MKDNSSKIYVELVELLFRVVLLFPLSLRN